MEAEADGKPISRIFSNSAFGYRTITVERPLRDEQGKIALNYAQGKFWASEHAVVVSPIKQVETFWLGELLRAMNLKERRSALISAAVTGKIDVRDSDRSDLSDLSEGFSQTP